MGPQPIRTLRPLIPGIGSEVPTVTKMDFCSALREGPDSVDRVSGWRRGSCLHRESEVEANQRTSRRWKPLGPADTDEVPQASCAGHQPGIPAMTVKNVTLPLF